MDEFDIGLDPVVLIKPDHQSGLIIDFPILSRDGDLCGEVARLFRIAQMTIVANEAVMGLPPEIRLVASCDDKSIIFAPPMRRLDSAIPCVSLTIARMEMLRAGMRRRQYEPAPLKN